MNGYRKEESEMKKVVFGITGLTLGGAERVLVDIANHISSDYDVTIFTLYGNGELEAQLNKKVKRVSIHAKERHELNVIQKIWMSVKFRFTFLRKHIYHSYLKNQYDVEVAFLEGPITWLFACPGKTRKLVWVHNDIKEVFGKGWKAEQKKKMNEHIYQKFDEIIFVSQDNEQKFCELYSNNQVPKRVIYNYLDEKAVLEKARKKVSDICHDAPTFVQVSRLTEQKGISRLIDVHKKLISDGYRHHIYIIGTGPLEDELQEKIKKYELEDTFHLLGKQSNPYPYIKAGDFFMLASLYEGYGMVIDEAKILDKFVMITDTAAREAVIGYDASLVVPNNEDGIYNGMKSLINQDISVTKKKNQQKRDIIGDIKQVLEGE